MLGAISAFSHCVSPQSGQAISPAFCWASKPSPSRNHASNSWPEVQRNVNRIIEKTSSRPYLYPTPQFGKHLPRVLIMYQDQGIPSDWVRRFAPLIRPGGRVLDLAAGAGRHTRFLLDMGFRVTAVDRDIEELQLLAGPHCDVVANDLETGAPWPLGGGYDGIVVTNYLHRPLLPAIRAALTGGGVLIYETFAVGNERL